MAKPDCFICADKGFIRWSGTTEVSPCPRCNPDSGYAPGEYEAELLAKHGRCGYAKGGGGRTCHKFAGHKDNHVFECGA